MAFSGFTPEDFDLFSIPEFPARMGAIRSQLRPKLQVLGEHLHPHLEALTGGPMYPHVAQHMRRRVNPPEETWVAFGRDRKGYKRWTHYRVAVSGAGVRVTVFVEDDADDKAPFGARLSESPGELLAALGPAAPIVWYTLGEGTPHAGVTPEALAALGGALQRLKTPKFQAGVPLPREEALGMSPDAFEEWARAQMTLLHPLYLAAASG